MNTELKSREDIRNGDWVVDNKGTVIEITAGNLEDDDLDYEDFDRMATADEIKDSLNSTFRFLQNKIKGFKEGITFDHLSTSIEIVTGKLEKLQ